jgi:hypothetical protein
MKPEYRSAFDDRGGMNSEGVFQKEGKGMRKVLLATMGVLLIAAVVFVLSCKDGHHGRRFVILGTFTERPAAATTAVTVEVRDAYTGQPIALADVWINNDTANKEQTNSFGVATFSNVPPGPFTLSAGKASYSIQTFHNVNSLLIRFALEPLPTSDSDYIKVSGTVRDCDSTTDLYIHPLTNQYGFAGQNGNVPGTSVDATTAYSLYVRKDLPFYMSAYHIVGGGSMSVVYKAHTISLPPSSTDVSPVDFVLSSITLTDHQGSFSNASNYPEYVALHGNCIDQFNMFVLAMQQGTLPPSGSATYVMSHPVWQGNFWSGLAVDGAAAGISQDYRGGTDFPAADMADLNTPLNFDPLSGSGTRPIATWSGGPFPANNGFYALEMQYEDTTSAGRPRFRVWTVFLPYDASGTTGFQFPEVPGTLSNSGFAVGSQHLLTLTARIVPGFHFHSGDFTSLFQEFLIFNAVSLPRQRFALDDQNYTP